jgi:hypothetical protein
VGKVEVIEKERKCRDRDRRVGKVRGRGRVRKV